MRQAILLNEAVPKAEGPQRYTINKPWIVIKQQLTRRQGWHTIHWIRQMLVDLRI